VFSSTEGKRLLRLPSFVLNPKGPIEPSHLYSLLRNQGDAGNGSWEDMCPFICRTHSLVNCRADSLLERLGMRSNGYRDSRRHLPSRPHCSRRTYLHIHPTLLDGFDTEPQPINDNPEQAKSEQSLLLHLISHLGCRIGCFRIIMFRLLP
jgi:hypothetical protein